MKLATAISLMIVAWLAVAAAMGWGMWRIAKRRTLHRAMNDRNPFPGKGQTLDPSVEARNLEIRPTLRCKITSLDGRSN